MICRRNLVYFITGLILHNTASAAIINVPADQPTIQAAINVALNGDEIIVSPGTYNEAINFLGKAITLRSSAGPDVTILNLSVGVGPLFDLQSVALDAANNRALVVDSGLDALLGVDLVTGDRTVISDDVTGTGPPFGNPLSVALDAANNRALVVDTGLNALLRVYLVTGDRTVSPGSAGGIALSSRPAIHAYFC